jgi:hypothetical protein
MAEKVSGAVDSCRFGYPTARFPFYHVAVLANLKPTDLRVDRVMVNGDETRDVRVFNGEQESFDGAIERDTRSTIVVRVDWENERSYTLEIGGQSPSSGKELDLERIVASAPQYGGYWDTAWKYYGGVVLTETAGVSREKEPIHLTVSFYEDRIASPQEIRVVGIDPESGAARETPCQVYGFERWESSHLVAKEPSRYQPAVTIDVAFLADVPASSEKVYLVFYGNPNASEPGYETDLRVSGEGLKLEIENSYYRMNLHDKGGLIDEIFMKQGIDTKLDHHVEPPGTIHWNPDCYSPPHIWSHTSNWDPPPHSMGTEGPVFVMRKYWGKLPFDVDQVSASVTYLFYAHNPYVIISTTMRVDEPLPVKVMRNGCFVLRRELFNDLAWKDRAGKINHLNLDRAPAPPKAVMRMAPEIPWLAFLNREQGFGIGAITLSFVNERFDGGLVRAAQPHYHVMVGPWVGWSRMLVNTFLTNNPQRMVQVPKGCLYVEKNACLPFKLGKPRGAECAILDQNWERLINPLEVREVSMDTDPRVPKQWVPPFLPEGFEV